MRLSASGLYPVLTIALACFAFGAPTLLAGSGFVAVYAAAVVLGNGPLPHASGLRRVHDAMAWFSQVAMFLLLGLLAFPSRLASVAGPGLFLGLFLALVARPVMVFALLLPFRMPLREVAFVSWVGLRGAVPIMLATFPVLAGLPYAQRVFDLVFFVVVVSAVRAGDHDRLDRPQARPRGAGHAVAARGAGDQLDPAARRRGDLVLRGAPRARWPARASPSSPSPRAPR